MDPSVTKLSRVVKLIKCAKVIRPCYVYPAIAELDFLVLFYQEKRTNIRRKG